MKVPKSVLLCEARSHEHMSMCRLIQLCIRSRCVLCIGLLAFPQEHFTQMRVVGQFNLGFMICLLGSDLFILDQHACDEKYNFEVLQKTTIIHQQPLVR